MFGSPSPADHAISGRITYGDWGLTFIVDGAPLSPSDLIHMMDTYEGWQFKLSFIDFSDDAS